MMHDLATRTTIVAIGSAPALASAFKHDPAVVVETVLDVDAAVPAISRHPRPDLIVVGSKISASHVAALPNGGDIPLLFLVEPEKLTRFRAGLPFLPRLGKAWTLSDDTDPISLRDVVTESIASSRGRTDFGTVISRINAQLTRSMTQNSRQNEHRLSDRYFSTLLSTVPDAFFAMGRHGRLIAFNEAAAALFSIDDHAAETSLADFIPESARPALAALLERSMSGEIIRLAELPVRTAGGHDERWIELSLALVRAEDGFEESISGIAREVTDRRRMELELRRLNETLEAQVADRTAALLQSEVSMRTVFETSHQSQWLVSPDGALLYANKTALDSIGRTLEEVESQYFSETPWFTGTPGAQELVRQAIVSLAEKRSSTISLTLDLATGRRSYDFSIRPVYDRAGNISAMVPEALETTARLQAEEALRQSQKMEAVGQLTGGIAHDFNNLLTVISGNMEMVMRRLGDETDARVRRGLDSAIKGAERASMLTQRLLAFSRRQSLDPKPLDVGRLMASMSQLLSRTLGETIMIETVVSAGLWRVEVDANQLENAILNLAVNARDAMQGSGHLTVEASNSQIDRTYAAAHPEVAPGSYVVIAISDTGGGMTGETQARAFDPFFTTKEVGKGTGLGLSMVYGFVKQSGGHVKIYSEIDHGTTIKIYLPRLANERSDSEPDEVIVPEPSAGSETILVVEDDDDVRAFTVESLRELGYRILEAHDGPSALRLLERQDQPIDLLFTDVVMPEMSGRELADAARHEQPDLRVLFKSGYTRNAMSHAGRLDAGVELLPKPFTFTSLAQKVRELLDR